MPLGVYQGASSREGETSQVLWMGLSRPGDGAGVVMVGQDQDDGFVAEG